MLTPLLRWKSQPKQRAFLKRSEDCVVYGGARGGGKSEVLLAYMISRRLKYAGSWGIFVRRKLVDFYQAGGLIARSHQLLGGGKAAWNGSLRRWTFPNGSYFSFEHCQHDEDFQRFQGGQNDDICFDELTHFTERQFRGIIASRRTTRTDLTARIRATCNPGGVGHGWVKTTFVDPDPSGFRSFVLPGTASALHPGLTALFVPAKVYDNQILTQADPAYVGYLQSLPEALKAAWLEGSWDVFEGQVFREWRASLSTGAPFHVTQPKAIPQGWLKIISVDYGYAAPFCALWIAQSPSTKRALVYREAYASGLRDEEQAKLILDLSRNDGLISAVVADPSMWARRGDTAVSAADVYAREGVALNKAANDRIAGKMRVHDFLAEDERGRQPFLQVSQSCVNLIRTFPALVYDPHNVEDVHTESEDHAYDALRYGLMALSRPPRRIIGLQISASAPGADAPDEADELFDLPSAHKIAAQRASEEAEAY